MEWVRLGDIAEVTSGKNAPKENEFSINGHPFIRAGHLEPLIQGLDENSLPLISFDTAKKKKYKLYKPDTIIFAKSGMSILKDRVYMLKKPSYIVNHLAALEINKPDVNSDFIKYQLSYLKPSSLIKGESYPSLSLTDIKNLKLFLPTKSNQNKIVGLLNKVEVLIKIRKEQVQAYDDLIESLFFEIINKSPINEVSFDDLFEIIDGDRGKNYPKKNDLLEEGYCLFLNTKNVTKTGFKFDQQEFITKEKDEKLRKGRSKIGDFILTTRGTVGNIAYIDKNIEFKNIRINSGMVILRKKLNINPKFFEVLIRKTDILLKAKSGSAQPQLPIKSLKKVFIPTVDIELQNKFADYVIKIEEEKKKLRSSLAELETLFDALMQDAFSGNLFKD